MLSFFPEILFLSPFAAVLIRITLAVLLAYDGWNMFSQSGISARVGSVCAFLFAGLLFVGAWTQLAALMYAIAFTIYLVYPYGPKSSLPKSTIALAIVLALTLVVTGPGPLAFDLPL